MRPKEHAAQRPDTGMPNKLDRGAAVQLAPQKRINRRRFFAQRKVDHRNTLNGDNDPPTSPRQSPLSSQLVGSPARVVLEFVGAHNPERHFEANALFYEQVSRNQTRLMTAQQIRYSSRVVQKHLT